MVKQKKHNGIALHVGITPTVSIGSADLHSVAQLYLAGPRNSVTTFISVREHDDIKVSGQTPFNAIVPLIKEKTYGAIMRALLEGIQKTYELEKLPFMTIELPEISAYYIGQLMQLKMLEIIYLGTLCTVNPFDQPQIELVKQETRKILAHD